MSETRVTTVQVCIKGRVQGVWYRSWTRKTAVELGLCGWVRNRIDGSVEALFSGPDHKVEAILKACHQGPPAARVDSVVSRVAAAPDDAIFLLLPTA